MNSEDSSPPGTEPAVPAQPEGPKAVAGRGVRDLDWIAVIGLAAIAAIAAWQVGEYTFEYARPSLAASENYRDSTALNAEMPGVSAVNGALTFGAFGGILGLAMGLAGGFARRSVSHAVLGAAAGMILGIAAGALPSLVAMPWHWRHRNDDPFNADLLSPFLVHLALWTCLGLSAGVAFAIGRRGFSIPGIVEAGLAGLIGAVFGTFVFDMVGALLFPAAGTTNPFALTTGTRLLARLCVALCVGLGLIRSLPPATAVGVAKAT